MCSLWYENNQFGYSEIKKIKGKFEQKQIYHDRLSSSGKFKSCGSSSMKQHQAVSSEGKKTSPDFSSYADSVMKNRKPRQLAKISILSLLFFSGVRVIDTTRQQSDLQFDRPPCKITLVCLVVTLAHWNISRTVITFTCHRCESKTHTCAAYTAHMRSH